MCSSCLEPREEGLLSFLVLDRVNLTVAVSANCAWAVGVESVTCICWCHHSLWLCVRFLMNEVTGAPCNTGFSTTII